jgi:hypothetical protein
MVSNNMKPITLIDALKGVRGDKIIASLSKVSQTFDNKMK